MLTVDIENLNSMIREKENEISNREKEYVYIALI